MISLYKIMFFNSMLMGTILTASSYSWIMAWMGLEINLLSIIPLLKNSKNSLSSEASLKYFISQILASSMLLFALVCFVGTKNPMFSDMNMLETNIVAISLLMKMGAAPFHFWLPEVLSGLDWTNSLIILTWQKIAPLTLLYYNVVPSNSLLFTIIIIISAMISGLGGLNQICLRKILAYSSINHVSWMIAGLTESFIICALYFCIYTFINTSIILIFKTYKLYYLVQLPSVFNYSKKVKFLFMMNFLSLGGLPPFLGFLPKWLVINMLTNNHHYFLITILIIFTLITLFYYIRIAISSFTVYSTENLMMLFNKMSFFQFFINFLSLTSLVICSIVSSFS